METQIFVPKKIKVGFQTREDTYTGKLGYVIYHDGKAWRKEKSWDGWRYKEGQSVHIGYEKDENGNYKKGKNGYGYIEIKTILGPEINPLEFTNEPIEGFVLNKKVGDYKSDWNHRKAYCRVYDPRGFEFEINIENLLYILENANSIKGKGLEGKFIYGWAGKDLILLPEQASEFQQIIQFTDLQSEKIGKKDLKEGYINC